MSEAGQAFLIGICVGVLVAMIVNLFARRSAEKAAKMVEMEKRIIALEKDREGK